MIDLNVHRQRSPQDIIHSFKHTYGCVQLLLVEISTTLRTDKFSTQKLKELICFVLSIFLYWLSGVAVILLHQKSSSDSVKLHNTWFVFGYHNFTTLWSDCGKLTKPWLLMGTQSSCCLPYTLRLTLSMFFLLSQKQTKIYTIGLMQVWKFEMHCAIQRHECTNRLHASAVTPVLMFCMAWKLWQPI